jgi:hypothetical protein
MGHTPIGDGFRYMIISTCFDFARGIQQTKLKTAQADKLLQPEFIKTLLFFCRISRKRAVPPRPFRCRRRL